jgi:protease I
MSDTQCLKGRRIALLAADGFEKVELAIPLRAMQLAGATVDIISLRHGRIRGVNLDEPASRNHVDKTVQEADPCDYDALMIPGGYMSPDLLRQSARARDFVRAFAAENKPMAVYCHGPWVLASAGLLQCRTVTSWPGIRDDMVHAGAVWLDQPTVRDGNLLTGRGPQDMVPFVRDLLEHFADGHTAQIATCRVNPTTSSPQRHEPPSVVLDLMRWLPRPSLRTAVAVIALGLGLGMIRARRRA